MSILEDMRLAPGGMGREIASACDGKRKQSIGQICRKRGRQGNKEYFLPSKVCFI